MRNVQYHIIEPVPELRDIVRFFWTFEGHATDSDPYILRTVANGCPELLFHYKGDFEEISRDKSKRSSFITGIHGQTDQHRRFRVHESFGIFGVYLYPYALNSVFGIPAIELTNELPDLESVLGRDSAKIIDRMHTANNNSERLSMITDYLVRQRRQIKQQEIMHVVQTIINKQGDVSIPDLSAQFFRSHRQFERTFKEQTGFTAKTFSRIVRFNSLLQRPRNTQRPLTEIALDFGYYDQSHFIHDFKSFSGYKPGTYFSGRAEELL
jgi:AraC-like DNA-binding protein